MSIDAFPISQRSPTVAPTTMQRWPNTLRRPIVVGIVGVADHHGVLEHRRPGADFDAGAVGADDRALGEQRPLTETGRADDHRGAGDLRLPCLGLEGRVDGSGVHGCASDGASSTANAILST